MMNLAILCKQRISVYPNVIGTVLGGFQRLDWQYSFFQQAIKNDTNVKGVLIGLWTSFNVC